jgi:hypothetical protein
VDKDAFKEALFKTENNDNGVPPFVALIPTFTQESYAPD